MGLPFEQTPINVYQSGLGGDGTFLSLAAVVDDYQTLRFKRGWYQPGDFQITINKNSHYASAFQRKRIIQLGDNVYKCGVIESVENYIGPTGAGSELITVSGRELTSFFDRRIVYPPSGESYFTLSSTTPVETVIKTLVYYSMGAGAAANRQVSEMTVETDTGAGDNYVLSARYDNLLTLISNACLATNSGVFVYLDHANAKWVLGWGLGVDRTTSQTTNPQAVFSTDRETVLDATLKDVDTGYKNFALVGGQGEGALRTIVSVPASEPTGIDRREMFVDARDLTVSASLTNRGLQKLAENQFVTFLTSDVLAYSQLIYGRDYDVGDNVTIQQFGLTQNSYITSAEEYWTKGAYNLSVGFDRSSPTLPSQVSGALNQVTKTLNATEIGLPIQPLSAAISTNTTYTLENIPGIKTILIPSAYLVASSGGAYLLTLSTGVGTDTTVPIAAFGNTITSGDLLFDIYINSSGDVIPKAWSIRGYNSNGVFEYRNDHSFMQFGTATGGPNGNSSVGSLYLATGTNITAPFAVGFTTINNVSAQVFGDSSDAESCAIDDANTNTSQISVFLYRATDLSATWKFEWRATGTW